MKEIWRTESRLEAHANYTGVKHRMNNFALRPVASAAATRQSDTYADTMGADVSLRFGSEDQHVRVGGDVELIDKGFMLYNPLAPAFFIHPLDRANRIGSAASSRGAPHWARFRQNWVCARIGMAQRRAFRARAGVPAGPTNLGVAFGRADRDWSGTSVDGALRLWAEMGNITPRLTLAHKTRVPSLVECFSWLPTEASGGLADGNIYVGNPQIKVEKAWLAELG